MSTQELSLRQTMNRIYKDADDGFQIPREDEQAVKKSKGSPIYGEINQKALSTLLDYLNLGPKDIFYDLGSGVGKVVLQTVLTTNVGQAYGIELSATRYQEAKAALEKAKSIASLTPGRLKFLNQDLLLADLSKATVVYTCSTAFSAGFMTKLTERLSQFKQPFRLVSLQDLPTTKNFELLDILKLDMSWTRKAPVHIYRRA